MLPCRSNREIHSQAAICGLRMGRLKQRRNPITAPADKKFRLFNSLSFPSERPAAEGRGPRDRRRTAQKAMLPAGSVDPRKKTKKNLQRENEREREST